MLLLFFLFWIFLQHFMYSPCVSCTHNFWCAICNIKKCLFFSLKSWLIQQQPKFITTNAIQCMTYHKKFLVFIYPLFFLCNVCWKEVMHFTSTAQQQMRRVNASREKNWIKKSFHYWIIFIEGVLLNLEGLL